MGTRKRVPYIYSGGVIVDGVLGTGLEGKARGTVASAIRFINASARHNFVVAIDIPSGLNSDNGRAEGENVRADLTITIGLPKKGLVEQRSIDYVGRLEVVDIGFPASLVEKIKAEAELATIEDIAPLFPARSRISHKGDYGHLLLMGGADGYSGAITLAALAAVRSGAGLVTVVVPENIVPFVAVNVPEAMVYGAPGTSVGSLDASCWKKWKDQAGKFSAVLAGPGMTRHPESVRLAEMILRDSDVPVVLDADALNAFEGKAAKLSVRKANLVITPHPGEMARLLGTSTDAVQANRLAAALKTSRLTGAVTVLKGAGTLVVDGNRPVFINLNGNPGMASGGTGDVLAGLLAGLLAQGMKPFDAARAAVFLHGRAGDLAAAAGSETALIARDLVESLHQAFREASRR